MELPKNLNEAQIKAITHPGGPVLVLAGAGSGKTLVLAYRFAYLVSEKNIPPDRIMALTFTNRAAKEMIERISRYVPRLPYRPWISTFHSACARILRENGESLEIKPDFIIYDESDQTTLIRKILRELQISEKVLPIGLFKKIWDEAANKLQAPEFLASELPPETAEAFYAASDLYRRSLKEANALDFGQLLSLTAVLLRTNPKVQKHYRDKFMHILVDEFQDTNLAQYELVKLLSNSNRNLFVVGDDDQSIYSWRGAEPENIFKFEKEFSPDVIVLNFNYRSTQLILDAANNVISKNFRLRPKLMKTITKEGPKLQLYIAEDEYDEAEFVARTIESLKKEGCSLRDIAVFYRTNAQSRAFEEEFINRKIPYIVVGGLRFYERKEIKDVLAYLTLLVNPRCYVSFSRAIQFPKRGIGSATIEKVAKLSALKNIDLLEATRELVENGKIVGTAKAGFKDFLNFIERLKKLADSKPVSELIEIILKEANFENEYLKEEGEIGATSRMENIFELAAAARAFFELNPNASLGDFLEQASLTTNLDSDAGIRESVSLMTLHCAKGLEFETVFLVGLEDGLLPHYLNMEDPKMCAEERRLCYVGITRAKKRLFLSYARYRSSSRFFSTARPSRFLKDIPQELFEKVLEHGKRVPTQNIELLFSEKPVNLTTGQLVFHPVYGKGQIVMPTPNARGKIAVIFFGKGLGAKEVDPAELTLD